MVRSIFGARSFLPEIAQSNTSFQSPVVFHLLLVTNVHHISCNSKDSNLESALEPEPVFRTPHSIFGRARLAATTRVAESFLSLWACALRQFRRRLPTRLNLLAFISVMVARRRPELTYTTLGGKRPLSSALQGIFNVSPPPSATSAACRIANHGHVRSRGQPRSVAKRCC